MQGRLVFEDTPLREVARELDRAFNIEITIADSALMSREVSGAFDTETVDEVLYAVTAAVGGRYERVGRTVVIRRRPMATRRPSQDLSHEPSVPLTAAKATGDSHE
jgi:ferric-dicitrate binding protein FerR (iron transport regulator)